MNSRLESLGESIEIEIKEKKELIGIIEKLKKENSQLNSTISNLSNDLLSLKKEKEEIKKRLEDINKKFELQSRILERALYENHPFIIDIAKKEGISGRKIKELIV